MRGFEFFGGVCRWGISDNLKTVVNKVLFGKERNFNNRLRPAVLPLSVRADGLHAFGGWEKGQTPT